MAWGLASIEKAEANPPFIRFAFLIAITLTLAQRLAAQTPRGSERHPAFPPRIHDPSTPVKSGNEWWIFSTGNGISSHYSTDLKKWTEGRPAFAEIPAWHREISPGHAGHLWAPDIVEHRGRYRLYYSVSSWGQNTSAIGLATNTTLDPRNPLFFWRDEGIVAQSNTTSRFNAIDPAVFIDDNQRHWMTFGSFWSGIQLIELDPATGKAHPKRKKIHPIAWHESIEAPAILKHGRYYYLFVNWGLCCRGLESTYEIRIGRSKTITGPYLDKTGRNMATGGGSLFLASAGDRIGPGHASFASAGSDLRMFYHYYSRKHGGSATLGIIPLKWTRDDWPEAGAVSP